MALVIMQVEVEAICSRPQPPSPDYSHSIMELQRLDYTELPSSDREIQQAADRQLYTVLSQLGFAKITNHPIGRPVVEELFSWVSD